SFHQHFCNSGDRQSLLRAGGLGTGGNDFVRHDSFAFTAPDNFQTVAFCRRLLRQRLPVAAGPEFGYPGGAYDENQLARVFGDVAEILVDAEIESRRQRVAQYLAEKLAGALHGVPFLADKVTAMVEQGSQRLACRSLAVAFNAFGL